MSIFVDCNVPSLGEVTICERNAEMQTENSKRKTKNLDIDYLRTVVFSDTLWCPQNLAKDLKKSAFVEDEQDILQKIYARWSENGLLGVLDEFNYINALPESVQKCLNFTRNITIHLHKKLQTWISSKFPQTDEVDKYSNFPEWKTSTIKAFACHPHLNRIAVGLKDDVVKIICIKTNFESILKEKRQKNVFCIAWRPLSACIVAVGCQNGIFLWYLDPVSQATRPNASQLQVLSHEGHSPVTQISWSKHGVLLASGSPNDSNIMIWDTSNKTFVALNRIDKGTGFLSWSPCGEKLLTCSLSPSFRVWDTGNWNCERWANLNGRCQVACWSHCGNILVFAVEDDPALYYVKYYDKSEENKTDIIGNGLAVKCCDLTASSLDTLDGTRTVGGPIQSMTFDPTGNRLAVIFRDDTPFGVQPHIAIFNTQVSPVLEISLCGFVGGQESEFPLTLAFAEYYEKGALLNVCWSSGVLSQIPLLFHRS